MATGGKKGRKVGALISHQETVSSQVDTMLLSKEPQRCFQVNLSNDWESLGYGGGFMTANTNCFRYFITVYLKSNLLSTWNGKSQQKLST